VTGLVPNRDLGAMLHGEVWGGFFDYAAGIFNGVGDARNSTNSDFDDNKSGQGRVFFHPFKKLDTALKGLGIGVSGSYQDSQGASALPSTTGGALPGYFTEGQQQFFAYNSTNGVVEADGEHWRLSPQADYYYGPFGFLAEYAISNQRVFMSDETTGLFVAESLDHRAWQISGSWILTGEDASFKGVTPRHPFNPRQGGWGALQLVARYSELDIDDSAFPFFSNASTSASKAAAWSVGLNWYLNKNILVKANFSHTDFTDGGAGGSTAPGSITSQDEQVFFTRMQLAF
jgi:phosphate-selective porin OprO and OprP